ncbi:HPr family phosphocarrier protein [Sinorhizobium sp. BG8]|uniref:HPr family phosphocarrier protein n=1 Tax=Sinorhizobium sp. BG8 TaxID=2613773 RepID=UPI00193C8B1A|nr:HPr family phosphocarrier protein [Sinorhizobium sp. BG8]QRM56818.1 HPr family phosphocarrier protein [Sinorhizobium sp. BG8]
MAAGKEHSTERARAEIEVVHDIGLHARPSVAFTRLAKSFPCAIEIEVNGSGIWLNGKSIVKVMGARIRKGSSLVLRAHGGRAEEAVRALRELIERNFDEGGDHVRHT